MPIPTAHEGVLMSGNRFGGTASEWFFRTYRFAGRDLVAAPESSSSTAQPLVAEFWDGPPEIEGRAQYADLLTLAGEVMSSITVNDDGSLPEFTQPDESVTRMWASADGGTTGIWITTSTIRNGVSTYAELPDKPTIPATAADVDADPAGTADAAVAPVVAALEDKVDVADLDVQTAALVETPGSEVATRLSAAFAGSRMAATPGNSWAAVGDSITSYNIGSDQDVLLDGWYSLLTVLSRGRVNRAGVFASGGYTLEQIESIHLPSVLALSPAPGACVVFGGTNNTGATGGTGFDFAAASATLERICSALKAASIMPIVVQIPPRSDSATVRQNVSLWNSYVYRLAQREGYPMLDAFTPLVDPATGGYAAGLSDDGIHPTRIGHGRIAQYVIDSGLINVTPPSRPTGSLWADPYNLIPSGQGLMLADANADGISDGWSAAGTATSWTPSRVDPIAADNLKGKWQQIVHASGGTGGRWLQIQLPGAGWSVGDVLSFQMRLQATGFATSGARLHAYVMPVPGSVSGGAYLWSSDVADGLLRLDDYDVRPGTTSLYVRVIVDTTGTLTGTATVRFGEVTVRNLTRMGLVGT